MYYTKYMTKKNITYSPQDKINNSRIYTQFLQIGLDDGWGRKDKQENFELLMKIFTFTNTPISGSTLLDVGCGTGDFVQFLSDKKVKEYVGVDIFEQAIEKAKDKFPEYTFTHGDFLKLDFKKFDFVVCSGALTTELDTDNYEIVQSWIPKMWHIAKKGVAFNFLIEDYSDVTNLFLYEPAFILSVCNDLFPKPKIKTITTPAGGDNRLQEMHVFLY